MNIALRIDLWLKRRRTLRKLSYFDERLLADMGVPPDNLRAYVDDVYRRKLRESECMERTAISRPARESSTMAAMPQTYP